MEDIDNIKNCEDVMIVFYVFDSIRSLYELEMLFVFYLNIDIEVVRKDKKIVFVVFLKWLWDEFLRLIDLNLCKFLYENIERFFILVLYEMEKIGFKVDRDVLF